MGPRTKRYPEYTSGRGTMHHPLLGVLGFSRISQVLFGKDLETGGGGQIYICSYSKSVLSAFGNYTTKSRLVVDFPMVLNNLVNTNKVTLM